MSNVTRILRFRLGALASWALICSTCRCAEPGCSGTCPRPDRCRHMLGTPSFHHLHLVAQIPEFRQRPIIGMQKYLSFTFYNQVALAEKAQLPVGGLGHLLRGERERLREVAHFPAAPRADHSVKARRAPVIVICRPAAVFAINCFSTSTRSTSANPPGSCSRSSIVFCPARPLKSRASTVR